MPPPPLRLVTAPLPTPLFVRQPYASSSRHRRFWCPGLGSALHKQQNTGLRRRVPQCPAGGQRGSCWVRKVVASWVAAEMTVAWVAAV